MKFMQQPQGEVNTYDEWKQLGFGVLRGVQAVGLCPETGAPVFSKEQVYPFEQVEQPVFDWQGLIPKNSYSDEKGRPYYDPDEELPF